MKKLIPIMLLIFLLSSCRNSFNEELSSKPDYPATVSGLKIEKAPEKIAVISSGLHNVIEDLSLSDKIVAVYSGSEDEALIKIGDEYHPDADKIIESGAEFLLTFTEIEYSVMNKLSEAGVRAMVFKKPCSVKDLGEIYSEIATLFVGENEGKTKGESAFSEYKAKLDGLKGDFGGKSFVYLKNRDLEPSTDNLSEGILEYIFDSENISEALTAESLGTLNPDYIFLDSGVDKAYITSLSSAENLSAVTNEKIFSLSSDSFSSLKEEPLNSLSELLKTE